MQDAAPYQFWAARGEGSALWGFEGGCCTLLIPHVFFDTVQPHPLPSLASWNPEIQRLVLR